MNTNEIPVTADGFIHIGQNCWASLDDIQRAVEAKQNPEAVASLTDNQGRMEHRVKHESPTFNIVPPKSEQWSEQRVLDLLQEPLELPSTMVRNEAKWDTVSHLDDSQHLPLPSTFRRVEQKPTAPTINRQCPQCQEHLIPLSTQRRKVS